MNDRPPRTTCARDRPTWVVAGWLVVLALVGCMASKAGVMWVVSRRF